MKRIQSIIDISETLIKRTGIIIILLFLIVVYPLPCQNKITDGLVTKGPVISFRETSHDFGAIAFKDNAIHFFVFANEGDSPLVILNVRASCGCVVQSWPKVPLAPGIKDSIRVEYNTKIKGAFNKTITVQSNATNFLTDLKITGNVTGKSK